MPNLKKCRLINVLEQFSAACLSLQFSLIKYFPTVPIEFGFNVTENYIESQVSSQGFHPFKA
jgi:hypothetical protein